MILIEHILGNAKKDPQLLIMREEDVLAREATEITARHSSACTTFWYTRP